ncbi:hypothetical protein [Spongiivirga citrea]|uniref:Glycosyl transferase family 28 C-terminal domain-containing protein n=1 Tax=Spongiivirga citrea TaxID=1481457 RepID=A0A6M0CFB0_9FLAO|nr:hypothetical protein [Spongiivirga citrea]NER16538.1 hypothetical protein [Spongiivirga citrea]
MNVFYVRGHGLGHLTRTVKLIKTLDIESEDVLLITASKFTSYFSEFTIVLIDSSQNDLSTIIIDIIDKYNCKSFYVDTFPLGINGELIDVYKKKPKLDYHYVSRVLKWDFYLDTINTIYQPTFRTTFLIEHLYPDHYNWIKNVSIKLRIISLTTFKPNKQTKIFDKPYSLIIHSGGKEDLSKLCHFALSHPASKSMRLVVFSQVKIRLNHPAFIFMNVSYPVCQYFKYAHHIYTAGGFNLVHELTNYKHKHTIIPVSRKFDDQKFRKLHT